MFPYRRSTDRRPTRAWVEQSLYPGIVWIERRFAWFIYHGDRPSILVILSAAPALPFRPAFLRVGRARSRRICGFHPTVKPRVANRSSLDSGRAAHPAKGRRDAVLARPSLGMTRKNTYW